MLFIAFVAILSITFGVMALVTSPSQGQKAIDRRMVGIRDSGGEAKLQPEVSQILKVEPTGNLAWLETILQRYRFSQVLMTKLMQADSKTTVAQLVLACLGLAIVGFLLSRIWVPVLPIQLMLACAIGYIPLGHVMVKRSRRIAAFNAALPDAIDMMGRALRAGHSMNASISIVAEQAVEPVASEFSEVFKQQNFGLPLRDALGQMLDHVPSADLRVLITGILVQKETGGNLAEILDRTVAVIRDRIRIQGEIKTHTAQGRLTGWILCLLPVFMLIAINVINPGYSNILFQTPFGHKLLYIGMGLLAAGGLIIRQIINGIEI